MSSIILGLFTFVVIVCAVLVYSTIKLLSKVRIVPDVCSSVEPEDLSEGEFSIHKSLVPEFKKHGFEFIGFRRDGGEVIVGMEPKLMSVFLDSQRGIYVDAYLADSPKAYFLWQFSLTSIMSSGHALITVDASNVTPLTPLIDVELKVANSIDFESMLEEHVASVEKKFGHAAPWVGNCDAFSQWKHQLYSAEIKCGLHKKELVKEGCAEAYLFSGKALFRSILQVFPTLIRQDAADRKAKKNRNGFTGDETSEVFIEASYQAYLKHMAIQESKKETSFMGLIWLIASVVVFAFAFKFSFSWEVTLTVIGVLFLHEMGHILAMKLFGYRDLRMLFIPMLGAVAMGKNENVKLWQEAIMLFMGPLPGIILALVLLAYKGMAGVSSPIIDLSITFLLAINLFNLIPIKPLDGGRIFSLVYFYKFPYLQAVFNIMSGIGLVLVGLVLDSNFLWIIGGIMVLNVPSFWRRARIIKLIREDYVGDLEELDKDSLLRNIFSYLSVVYSKKVPYNKRIEDAKEVYSTVNKGRPGWSIFVITTLIYLCPLWLPLVAMWPVRMINERNLYQAEYEWEAATSDIFSIHGSNYSEGVKSSYAELANAFNASGLEERTISATYQFSNLSILGLSYSRDLIDSLVLGFIQNKNLNEKFDIFLNIADSWKQVLDSGSVDDTLYYEVHEEIGAAFLIEALQHFKTGRVDQGLICYQNVFRYAEKLEESSVASYVTSSYTLRSAAIQGLAVVSRESEIDWLAIDRYMRGYWENILKDPKSDWDLVVTNQVEWSRLRKNYYGDDEEFYSLGWYTDILNGIERIWEAYGLDALHRANELRFTHSLLSVRPQLAIGSNSLNEAIALNEDDVDWALLLNQFSENNLGLVAIEDEWRRVSIHAVLALEALDLYIQKIENGRYPDVLGDGVAVNPVTLQSLKFELADAISFELSTSGVPYTEQVDDYTDEVYWMGEDATVPEKDIGSYDFF